MSFKLVGDNYSSQNVIRKRRIEELLSSDIPQDEALLMKNGRYCCTVCPHKPIFDTIPMLALHRKGKKHMTCANRKCLTETNKVDEIKKRIQVGTSKDTEVLAPLLEQVKTATARVLTSTKPYSAIATRKRQPSSANSSMVSMQPSKKTHDSHVTFNEGWKDTVPSEIKDYEYVQPWNAGFSSKKKARESPKSTTIDVIGGDNSRSLYADKSGWKRQKNGEWVRDPEAEFDSESEGDS